MSTLPKIAYSWYFSNQNNTLLVGPAGFGDAHYRELEDATADIACGHRIDTADWSRHVMEHHAMRVHQTHQLPISAHLIRLIPEV